MPKMPSVKDFGNQTVALGRKLRLPSYNTTPIAEVGKMQNQHAQMLAGGVGDLFGGIAKFGGKLDAEEEKRKKKGRSGGGGGGGGTEGEDFSQPMIDPETGKPIVNSDSPNGLTTDSAYNLASKFKNGETLAVDDLPKTLTPDQAKDPEYQARYLAELRKRGMQIKGAVHNSPFIKDTDKSKISSSLREHYYDIERTLNKTLFTQNNAISQQQHQDDGQSTFVPQFERVDEDPQRDIARVNETWQEQEKSIVYDKRLLASQAIEILRKRAEENTVAYLGKRYSYDEQVSILSGSASENEPLFMQKLGSSRKVVLKSVLEAQKSHAERGKKRLEELTASLKLGRPLTKDETAEVEAIVAKNPTLLEGDLGELTAARVATEKLRGLPPAKQRSLAEVERQRVLRKDKATNQDVSYVNALDETVEAKEKDIRTNGAQEHAYSEGLLVPAPVDFSEDGKASVGLQAQLENALDAQRNYPGSPLVILRPGQHEYFLDRIDKADESVFNLINTSFGNHAMQVYRELGAESKSVNPAMMVAIGRLTMFGNNDTAVLALRQIRRKKEGAFKSKLPSGSQSGNKTERDAAARAMWRGDGTYSALASHPEQARAIQEIANAIMDDKLSSGELSEWDSDAYNEALQTAAGRRMGKSGEYYGGIVKGKYKGAGHWFDSGDFTLWLPPTIPSASGVDYIRQATPQDLPRGAPVYKPADHTDRRIDPKTMTRTMTNDEFKTARLVQGDGGWMLVFGERNGKPMYWRDPEDYNKPYLLTLQEVNAARLAQSIRLKSAQKDGNKWRIEQQKNPIYQKYLKGRR